MKIWIHIDGVQLGPYDLSELPLGRMTPETPVWYEGLKYWEPAGKAAATAHLFSAQTACSAVEVEVDEPIGEVLEVDNKASSGPSTSAAYTAYRPTNTAAAEQEPPCPATYFIWALIITVLTFNPLGLVTLILGAKVKSKYRNYDYEGAKRTSETTAWWFMVTIVTSLIFTPFSWIISL